MAKELNITINFDMDGTIADLYGVKNWLPYLEAEDTTPYAIAKPPVEPLRSGSQVERSPKERLPTGDYLLDFQERKQRVQ